MKLLRWVLFWLSMIPIMILNALLREKVYGPLVNELTAHQLSTVTGCLFIGIYVWGIWPLLHIHSRPASIRVGVIWLILTIAFEFAFGKYIMHHSWYRLFNDYALWHGRVWALFLVWLIWLPYLIYRYRAEKRIK